MINPAVYCRRVQLRAFLAIGPLKEASFDLPRLEQFRRNLLPRPVSTLTDRSSDSRGLEPSAPRQNEPDARRLHGSPRLAR
jgi:hypothetical protein